MLLRPTATEWSAIGPSQTGAIRRRRRTDGTEGTGFTMRIDRTTAMWAVNRVRSRMRSHVVG